ncbi:MAG: lamin tail domain-containing protein [Bacteroidota bacterium]
MKAFRNLAIVLFLACRAYGQVTDAFSDGNFTANPPWTGNDTDFVISVGQLRLNSSGTDTSYLATANTYTLSNCEWNFWIRLNFSPSGNNYGRVYLVSDQQDLSGSLNGYYLQFGEALSNDQVELFRQNGTASTSVCRGTTLIASAFAIRVKVTRDASGLWTLLIDPTGGTNYVSEASGTDNTISTTNFFGVSCRYTTTNATQFYFDDFYVGPIIVDTAPPVIDSVNVTSPNSLDVFFSETVDLATSQTAINYSVNNLIGNPVSAVRSTVNTALVQLTFSQSFQSGTTYVLTTSNVQDVPGNSIITSNDTFVFYLPQYFDVLVNEIMADESPAVSLPLYEYVELHNRSGYEINLKDWTITIGSNTKTIPYVKVPADSFVVLTSTAGAPFYPGVISAGVTSFPSVTNTGNTITIRDSSGNLIHSLAYSDAWYQDAAKADGGWSLEMIDPANPCAGMSNWKASVNPSGGTPGKRNSVYASNPDVTAPQIQRVAVIAPYDTVQVFFTEPLDSTTLLNPASYSIDNGIGNPLAVDAIGSSFTSVKLTLSAPVQSGIIYTLTANTAITDCAGNSLGSPAAARFAIPQPCSAGDIVINEIMPDPKDNGVEWVEIYNRSGKVIDLSTLRLCSQDTIANVLTSVSIISSAGFLIFPGEYYVLSEDGAAVRAQYATANPAGFIDMASIPSLSNDGDIVVIADAGLAIIDKLVYSSGWHFPLLNSTKGFSLERISFDRDTQDPTNWHSASQTVEATPAYRNSQYSEGESGDEVVLSPEIFSPDNDGYNDVISISYQFDSPGFIASVRIYDSRGRLARTLVNNELLGSSGTFSWDGITDEQQKAGIGIYVIYVEVYNSSGEVKKFKKTCVVAGKI